MWKQKQYRNFLKKDNWDCDFISYFSFLEVKLTVMALEFIKVHFTVNSVAEARMMWKARQCIRRYNNAFDIAEEICQKKFIEKYGCRYETQMCLSERKEDGLCSIGFNLLSPVSDKKEAEDFWSSLKSWELETEISNKAKKELFDILNDNIQRWWY